MHPDKDAAQAFGGRSADWYGIVRAVPSEGCSKRNVSHDDGRLLSMTKRSGRADRFGRRMDVAHGGAGNLRGVSRGLVHGPGAKVRRVNLASGSLGEGVTRGSQTVEGGVFQREPEVLWIGLKAEAGIEGRSARIVGDVVQPQEGPSPSGVRGLAHFAQEDPAKTSAALIGMHPKVGHEGTDAAPGGGNKGRPEGDADRRVRVDRQNRARVARQCQRKDRVGQFIGIAHVVRQGAQGLGDLMGRGVVGDPGHGRLRVGPSPAAGPVAERRGRRPVCAGDAASLQGRPGGTTAAVESGRSAVQVGALETILPD